jgi:hypothetical protein
MDTRIRWFAIDTYGIEDRKQGMEEWKKGIK